MNQTTRIVRYFKCYPNMWLPMPLLSQVGSGKEHGYCASWSKRKHEAAKALEGEGQIEMREERSGQQRKTFYRFVPKP